MALSAWIIRRHSTPDAVESDTPSPAPTAAQKAFWAGAAFVASGLMLAVTNEIGSDVASAPFIWILPLAVYLLTFIIAFAPGALEAMSILAFALHLDPAYVGTHHIVRYLFVSALIPLLIRRVRQSATAMKPPVSTTDGQRERGPGSG